MDTLMILCAKYLYVVVILLAIIFILMQKRQVQLRMLILAVVSMPLAYLVAKIAGHFYFDPRPFVVMHIKPLIDHAATNGFPSDHMLISTAIAAIVFVYSRKWGIATMLLAIVVGLSRVYVRVHSPIDIIGAFLIASVVVILTYYLLKKYLFPKFTLK